MLLFIGKTILLYVIIIIIIRLMGKSAFAQLTAHDLAGIFFVITLATGPVVTTNVVHTIVGMVVIGIVHIGFSKLMLFNRLKTIVIGQPTIVIKHGNIMHRNLTKSHFTLSELLSELREKGHPDMALIDFAFIEPSGDISIFPKPEASPVTPDQLGIETIHRGLPVSVIIEGEIQQHNLQLINRDEQWLEHEMAKAGFPNISRVFYAAVREQDHSLVIDGGPANTNDG
ncbi:DUF421 domain-containing protein [Lentibacillus sp. CBA3610]|uniref:DUF421 domain-containing protein n=1 Tax=Lentibacillus sp. CBA3610 TaxID=2518176 RepID=UPI00159558C3|nr:DUF421 domain-containing protein [Lentibacillus sp. CBA3610]QKY68634.1 DUF421 domain-containing protein [Lentibacillus sp. CBA3610]